MIRICWIKMNYMLEKASFKKIKNKNGNKTKTKIETNNIIKPCLKQVCEVSHNNVKELNRKV